MENPGFNWPSVEAVIQEILEMQHKKTLACGRRIIPALTADDMLQPNDFPLLENHPEFRYEEGVLEGIRTVHMALRALFVNEPAAPVHHRGRRGHRERTKAETG